MLRLRLHAHNCATRSDLSASRGRVDGRRTGAYGFQNPAFAGVLTFFVLFFFAGLPVLRAEAKEKPASSEPAASAGAAVAGTDTASSVEGSQTEAEASSATSGSGESERPFLVREYRVRGAKSLPRIDIEKAVYPYLGQGRNTADLEKARAAVEEAYHSKGYQAVAVELPQQTLRGGVVILEVAENPVGRLRVRNSRYYDINRIKSMARSMAEGRALNFNEINKDIIALNQMGDLRVTPEVKQGTEPGTMDIDLVVKDTFPLHGNIELNNRQSPDTNELRLSGGVSYSNLWQLGHTIGFNFQIAPQRLEDSEVYSGFYLFRVPFVDWLSIMIQGVKQDSTTATIGGVTSSGPGHSFGSRAIIALPSAPNFFQSFSVGFDYKDYRQVLAISGSTVLSDNSIRYYPLTADYGATWTNPNWITEFNASVVMHFRGTGDDAVDFDKNRYNAGSNFIYLRGDLSHTHELPVGLQAFGKVQGQIADQPLVSNEQFSAGGLDTVRGYLEGEVVGDNAVCATLELRSPSLIGALKRKDSELRLHAFGDIGTVSIYDALPEQDDSSQLASFGFGARMQLLNNFNGSVDLAFPLISGPRTDAWDPRVTFRAWAEF